MRAKMSAMVDKRLVEKMYRQVETQRFQNRDHTMGLAVMKFAESENKGSP